MNLDLFESTPEGDPEPQDPEPREPEAQDPEPRDPEPQEREAAAGDAPEADGPRVWSVSEVNRAVRALLEEAVRPLWVAGEVGNWTRARSGHRYFTLKDDSAELDCVMWRTDAARLPTDPDEGTSVRAFGSLTLYEARGRYQLVVRRLEGDGAEGLWRIAFEKLRKKLEAEGLLADERKRPIPRFPERVGVVTSTTGAALRDVLTVIRRRAPWTRVLVRGTRVQGEGAAEEIAEAVRVLAESGRVDVLIVGRGGGSVEDLWAFNEEPVARAVAASPVPVISAVGHEVDVTIADLVADHRCPTPSAAAEAAVPDREALLDGLQALPGRLARGLRGALERRWRRVDEAYARLERGLERFLAPRRERVERAHRRLGRGVRAVLERRRHRLAGVSGKLEALSPLSTMRRGYAVPLRDGRVLRRADDFDSGTRFDLRVVDGRIGCEVRDVREEVDGD